MIRRLALLPIVAISTLAPTPALAQSGLGQDARVTAGILDNGLNYLVMPVAGDARGSAVRLIVDAGLIHESEGQFGAADVAAQAARIRAGDNASASVDAEHSVVGFDLTDSTSLAARLNALAGIAAGAPAADVVTAARNAAADSLAQRPAIEIVHDQAMRRLVPGSRAVRRPAAGLPDTVRSIAPAAVGEFLSRWYVASNMTVVVVAPGTADELRTLVQGAFGALPRMPRPASPGTAFTAWNPPAAPILIEDGDLTEAIVAVVSARPGRQPASVRDFRSRVVQEAGARLLQRITETRIGKEKVPFTSVDASNFYAPEGLVWTSLMVSGDPASWRELATEAVNEVNRIRIHGVDRGDVSETLIEMANDWEADAKAEDTAPASALADMLVDTRGGASRQRQLELLLAVVGSISADDVEWEFNKRFDPFTSAVVVALPSRPGNPSEADLAQTVEAAWAAQPDPASELVRPWKLMPTLPVPGEVAEMTQDTDTGVWSGWLANGVRFHVRQMASREPGGVDIAVTIAGGELMEDAMTRGFTEALGRGWELMSIPGMESEEVFNLFQPSGARMQSIGLPDMYRVVANTKRAWFNPFMQRLHVMLSAGVPSAEVIARHNESLGREMQVAETDTSAAFTKLMVDTQYLPGEPRVRPTPAEMAARTTVESVNEWGRRVASQCPIEIAIVGDIDPQDAIEAVRFYLGSLPSRPRISPETFRALRTNVHNPLPHIGIKRMTAMGLTNTLTLRAFYISDPENRAESEVFRVAASVLNTRLTASAPTLGLPGGGFVSTNFGDAYPGISFLFYAVQTQVLDEAAVANLQKVVEAEFARFAAEGPTQEELESAVEALASEVEGNLDATSGWWDFLSTATYRGRSLEDLTGTTVRLRGLTRDRVREVFAAYFSRPNNRLELAVIPPPPDQLMEFINKPPAPAAEAGPQPEAAPDPAGPPSGDPDAPGL